MRGAWLVMAGFVILGRTICLAQSTTPNGTSEAPSARGTKTVDHFQRTREWEQVKEYMAEEGYYVRTHSAWWHKPENREKSAEDGDKALGLHRPDAEKAHELALDVMTSDPTDDLGFMAIEFCMRFKENGEPAYKCTDEALNYLDRYY